MKARTHRLERSRLLYLSVDSARPAEIAQRTCTFLGGRTTGEDGGSFVFSGPPPAEWNIDLPAADEPVDIQAARKTLDRLVRGWKGRSRLQYLARTSVRMVCNDCTPGTVVTSRTWALLGNVTTPSGRIVPVGQSGRGSGLLELEREIATGDFARMLDRIDRSEPLGGGTSPAVLAPPAAAVLVHEAIGHFAEAAPEGRVRLDHRLGFRIAAEIFNLRDDPGVEGGAAHYVVDDDGVPARGATEVVRDGRMLCLLHCTASARAMEAEPTGNARSASVWDPPLPRMSNLLCDPGTASEEEMLDRMGDGLYLHSLAYGYGFGFRLEAQVRLAEEVRAGRQTGRYLSGGVVDEDRTVLTRAAELGNIAVFNRNAMCGKEGQILYDVGTRAPAIRLSALRISA